MKDWLIDVMKSCIKIIICLAFSIFVVYGLTSEKTRSIQISKPLATILLALVLKDTFTNRR